MILKQHHNSMTVNAVVREKNFIHEIERVLSPYFVKMRFNAGQVLWNEGETAKRMVSLITGKVKIFRPLVNGKQAAIYIFGAGDTFGFMPFIDGSPYPASAEVVEESEAMVMTRERLLTAMRQDPDIAVLLLNQMAKRLRSAFDQIEILSTKGVIPRTASALLSLSVQSGGRKNLEIIALPVSSKDYAALAGLTPESFSRGITKLVDMRIIHRLKGNSFQILNYEKLLSESKNEL